MPDHLKFASLMSAVGHALHGWSQVESTMELLFSVVSEIPTARKAAAIYNAIIAFEARLAVLDTAVELSDHYTEHEKVVWDCLSARLRKLYKKRHEVAHFLVPSPQEMDAGERISPFFTWDKFNRNAAKYLTIPQLKERSSKFTRAAEAVSWFTHALLWKTQPPGAGRQQPEPPELILHIEGLLARKKAEQTPPHPPAAE